MPNSSAENGKSRDVAVNASARIVLAVLRLAAVAATPLTIAEISRRLGVSVNKAYRAVATLEGAGYIRRNPVTRKFECGPVAERLVYAAFERFPIRAAMSPFLRQIATSAEATTSLVVPVGWYGVTLALVESGTHVVSRAQRLGRSAPLHRTAAGLAILAWMLPADAVRYTAFAAGRWPDAPGAADLERRLSGIRGAGFAAGLQWDAANMLAIPLRGLAGEPIAALAIEAAGNRAAALDADPLLQEWLGMAAQAEDRLQANADILIGPYAHLDPDGISLRED